MPSSRGGPGGPDGIWNLYPWENKEHQAWHKLFLNHMPSEVIKKIEGWMNEDGIFKEERLKEKRFSERWSQLFDDLSPKEAIEFIKQEFIPAENYFFEVYKQNQKRGDFYE